MPAPIKPSGFQGRALVSSVAPFADSPAPAPRGRSAPNNGPATPFADLVADSDAQDDATPVAPTPAPVVTKPDARPEAKSQSTADKSTSGKDDDKADNAVTTDAGVATAFGFAPMPLLALQADVPAASATVQADAIAATATAAAGASASPPAADPVTGVPAAQVAPAAPAAPVPSEITTAGFPPVPAPADPATHPPAAPAPQPLPDGATTPLPAATAADTSPEVTLARGGAASLAAVERKPGRAACHRRSGRLTSGKQATLTLPLAVSGGTTPAIQVQASASPATPTQLSGSRRRWPTFCRNRRGDRCRYRGRCDPRRAGSRRAEGGRCCRHDAGAERHRYAGGRTGGPGQRGGDPRRCCNLGPGNPGNSRRCARGQGDDACGTGGLRQRQRSRTGVAHDQHSPHGGEGRGDRDRHPGQRLPGKDGDAGSGSRATPPCRQPSRPGADDHAGRERRQGCAGR